MAGIAGTLDLRAGLPGADALVRQMLATLAHRGPDGETVVSDGAATLGLRSLAVLDGAAPTCASGALLLALDGDLLSSGATSQSQRLIAAWARSGAACLDELDGGFAFAVWDSRAKQLTCVRDRLGLKPLYYTESGGRFRFASEIKALLADPVVPREPNDRRILQYLAYGISDHSDETMLRGIRCVPAGGMLVVDAATGTTWIERWYEPRPRPEAGPVAARVRTLVETAVAASLTGSGVVGATLSGGLDSSAVLATAAVIRRREGREPPLAFVSRSADRRSDEWPYASLVLRRFGIECVEVTPQGDDLVEDFDELTRSLDEPCHSASVYGHRRVLEAARAAGVDVVLEGQMGERFGGLDYWYPQLLFDMLSRGRLDAALRELAARRRVQGVRVEQSLLDLAKLLLPARVRAAHRAPPSFLRVDAVLDPPPLPGRTLLAVQLHTVRVNALPTVLREVDRNASAFGLAERSPFGDHRILEYALSLPAEVLYRGGRGKAPLIDAMRGLVPDEILERRTKQGFTVDERQWLDGPLGRDIDRVFQTDAAVGRPYWDAAAVRAALAAARGGAPAAGLWRAYSVERWLELVVDAAPSLTEVKSRGAEIRTRDLQSPSPI